MSVKTDNQITQDVLAELAWDPAVTIADLRVSSPSSRAIWIKSGVFCACFRKASTSVHSVTQRPSCLGEIA
jgi:hypothetical protein